LTYDRNEDPMSISTPQGGGTRRTDTGKTTPRTTTVRVPGARPSSGGSGGNRKRPPMAPIKVAPPRNWMPIIISVVVGVIALGIVGYGGYQVYQKGLDWQKKADGINGIKDYRKTDPTSIASRNHVDGPVVYKQSPPVGGNHNPNWQRCAGDVYPAAIANENAVHSLEHGAVWVTYNPSLPAAQVAELAAKVKGNDYMLMSPFPGLSTPISLQAWGYQLPLTSATDPRIDQFIQDLRVNASMEPGIDCSSGTYITATGTTPHDPTAQPSAAPSGVAPSGVTPSTPVAPTASGS
jgi:hypothetical protein